MTVYKCTIIILEHNTRAHIIILYNIHMGTYLIYKLQFKISIGVKIIYLSVTNEKC